MSIEQTLERIATALERLNATSEIMLERNTIALSKSLGAVADRTIAGDDTTADVADVADAEPVDLNSADEPDHTIEVSTPAAPKRVRPSRAKGAGAAAEPAPVVTVNRINGVVQPPPEQAQAVEHLAPAPAITLDQVNSELQRYVQVEGKSGSAIMEILGAYHPSRSLRNIDPSHFAEILTRVEAL